MMDVREKLVKLLDEGFGYTAEMKKAEDVADMLIAHGMTVQRWISVEERLPRERDADENACVLAIHKKSNQRYYHWRSVADNSYDFTHWMPLPEPPKGE